MQGGVTAQLAKYISSLHFRSLPLSAVEAAKKLLLDYLASYFAGIQNHSVLSKELLSMMKTVGGKEEASVLGEKVKLPLINVALVNGTISHVVELDDGHRIARGHPGVTVMTTALAVGEYIGATGEEMITAIVAGYDIFVRLASSVNPSHLNRGYHTTGTCGTLASAATAAVLLKLSEEQTVSALGLAGTQSAGLLEVTESGQMAKAFHAGKSAQAGILAAVLAEKDALGPNSILEGIKGFCRTLSDDCDYQLLVKDLGKKYYIEECYIKLYPSCRHTHSPIDAMLCIRSKNSVNIETIEKIIITTFPTAISFAGKIFHPESPEEAKFSIPFSSVVALIKGDFSLNELSDEYFLDQEIFELIKKVEIVSDPDYEKEFPKTKGAQVEIIFSDGTRLKEKVSLPKGELENPVSLEEVIRKFKSCLSSVYSNENTSQIIHKVLHLEKAQDISEWIQIFDSVK